MYTSTDMKKILAPSVTTIIKVTLSHIELNSVIRATTSGVMSPNLHTTARVHVPFFCEHE